MSVVGPFSLAPSYSTAEMTDHRGVRMAAAFGPAADEYRAARENVALFDRSDRGLIVLAGSERKEWLHNLVTSAVLTLDDHAGVYAFAINVKGRILFDLNILCLPEALWLDLDLPAVAAAAAHFDRYLFTEDVKLQDATGEYGRLGCGGPRAADVAARLGVPNLPGLPALSSVALHRGQVHLVRHDFAGLPGFELFVPRGEGAQWWERLVQEGARPAGLRTLDVLRVEAGLPWLGRDIDDQVLPPETGLSSAGGTPTPPGGTPTPAPGISYEKGCYLGQEILERMRARSVLARRLVRVRVADGAGLALPAALTKGGADVGRITSLVKHPVEPHWPGLGYLKTSVTDPAGITTGIPPRAVTIA